MLSETMPLDIEVATMTVDAENTVLATYLIDLWSTMGREYERETWAHMSVA